MKIEPVPLEWVHVVWSRVAHWISAALEYSLGECTVDQARAQVSDGRWVLYVWSDANNLLHGAAIVEYQQRFNDRVALVIAIGGRGLFTPESVSQFKALVMSRGATAIEGAQRPAMARLWQRFGAVPKYMVQEVRLYPDNEVGNGR